MKAVRATLRRSTVGNRQGGFTVLETLIAVSILTVGLLAIAKMQVSAIWGNAMSGNTTAALTLAEEKMENLLEKAYVHADLSSGTHEQVDINEAGQPGGPYHRIWAVQDDTPIPDTKTITVTVRWAQDRHHVSLSCIKAR